MLSKKFHQINQRVRNLKLINPILQHNPVNIRKQDYEIELISVR